MRPPRLLFALALLPLSTAAQTQTTLEFENSGIEAGVTSPGAIQFTIAGSDWSGGVVQTMFVPPLYSSGGHSYEMVLAGNGEVNFHDSVSSVSFFFVHGFGVPAGTATFFDSAGNQVAGRASNPATSFGDPGNFVTASAGGIARIVLTGGVVDSFSWTTSDDCAPGASLCGDRHFLRLSQGGVQGLTLDAGAAHAGGIAVSLGSITGTAPALVLDGVAIPIAFDLYTTHTLVSPNPPLSGSFQILDGNGQGVAAFAIPTGLNPNLAGTIFYHAFAVVSPSQLQVVFASNAETVTLVP